MTIKSCIIFTSLIFLYGCTKTEQVRFHGRVTYSCNDESAEGIKFSLYRYFDTGSQQAELIREFHTNGNGIFDFIEDVPKRGIFQEYRTQLDMPNFSMRGGGQAGIPNVNESSANVEINCSIIRGDYFKCHIKNLSPYNSNDKFLYLEEKTGPWPVGTIIRDLTGANIDTIIYFFTDPESENLFKYAYSKNGITHTDTISFPHFCFDTIPFELNY